MLSQVQINPESVEKFRPLIGEEATDRLIELGGLAAACLEHRTVWNVNSSAAGGGVAEMLQTILAYGRGAGIDVRWLVTSGDSDFFKITKRLHNGIHGSTGDNGPLGTDEHAHYQKICEQNAAALVSEVKAEDIVILHDPQTAGMIRTVLAQGAIVVWRCHIGLDGQSDVADRTWDFLKTYIKDAHAYIFSRKCYAPDWLDENRLCIISPSIDPFSSKNNGMDTATAQAILAQAGIIAADGIKAPPTYVRTDGTTAQVQGAADILRTGAPPSATTPLVCQVSRWDRLKDMQGVLEGFANFVASSGKAHLSLVGPVVNGVADDPEQVAVYEAVVTAWRKLPNEARSRIQLVCLPMIDIEENAAIVNALQRHAKVVTQKSLREGFGLTVSEAMWKSTPLVGSAVGGIKDQIEHGVSGLLVEDPTNLEEFGKAILHLLNDLPQLESMGRKAKERVKKDFLASRHLEQFGALLVSLVDKVS